MTDARWRKVLQDLIGNKTRTVLVVLSIAVGVFAVGTVVGAQAIIARDIARSYVGGRPASAILYTSFFDNELVQTVRHMPEVREAEGRRSISVRLKVGPKEWRNLNLTAISDYDNIRLDVVRPERGAWPPPDHGVLIERAALQDAGAAIGDMVLIETSDGKQRELHLAGTAFNSNYMGPLWWGGWLYGYITFDTMEWLGAFNYDELHIVASGDAGDTTHVRRIADLVSDKIEQGGWTVYWKEIPPPEHPAAFMVNALMVVLSVLGTLCVFLSGLLVVNTISALLAQQVRQIGVMKTVGADIGQLVSLYLTLAMAFGLLAAFIAVPSAILAARALAAYIAGLLNFDVGTFSVPPQMIVIQVVIGLITPLLAALAPVMNGARITVREAISTYGLGKGRFGQNRVDRLVERVRGLPRPTLLSLRNTFRRKARLALTLTTLTLGGAIFMAVLSVQASLELTTDDLMNYYQEDVQINLSYGYRAERVEQQALAVPGVERMEGWGYVGVRRVRADDSESNTVQLTALPAASEMIRPIIVEGRWLLPEDENALVVGTDFLRQERDVQVGDEITLNILGRKMPWRVVGIFLVIGNPSGMSAYANDLYVARVAGVVGRIYSAKLVTAQHDPAFQATVATALEERFKNAGLSVGSIRTNADLRGQIESQLTILIVFLLVMAVIIALVGGLGLMGTMSINVLERTREFGVLRAIGASDGAVRQIVVVEGVLIGTLSWLLGAALALPISKLLSDNVGQAFLNTPLHYTFPIGGVLIWLLVVVVLAALASLWPAWNASRLTVREVLAYE